METSPRHHAALDQLQALRSPALRLVVEHALSALAGVLQVDSVLLWLHDGKVLRLMGTAGPETPAPPKIEPGQGVIGECFNQGRILFLREGPASEPWIGQNGQCQADKPSQICMSPVRLAGHPVGVLLALRSSTECQFQSIDLKAVETEVLRLILNLHHCAIVPEASNDWLTVFEAQSGPCTGTHRLENCPLLLAHSLPKGINGPTLKAVCRHVHFAGKDITCRQVAEALGLSRVTAGRYLAYMLNQGLVRRSVDIRHVGRPAYLYCAERRCPQVHV